MLSLVMLNSADTDNLIVIAIAHEALGFEHRWIKHFACNAVVTGEPLRYDLRVCKNTFCFAQRRCIDLMQRTTKRTMSFVVGKPPVQGVVPQIVERSDVVNEPEDLVWVLDHMGLRPKANDSICRR